MLPWKMLKCNPGLSEILCKVLLLGTCHCSLSGVAVPSLWDVVMVKQTFNLCLTEKTLLLKSTMYKPWTTRFQGFMGIRSLAKQIQSSFDKSLHCHEMLVRMQIPRVLCLRHAVVFFCLPRTLLGPILWFSSVR